jgi:hypothetical protein
VSAFCSARRTHCARGRKEEDALREEEVNRLQRKVGELTMDLDILREAARQRPTTPGTSDE